MLERNFLASCGEGMPFCIRMDPLSPHIRAEEVLPTLRFSHGRHVCGVAFVTAAHTATAARGPSRRKPTLVMPSPRVHWRPMPSVSHAAFGGRRRRAVLAATPVSGGRSVTQAGGDRALSTFKSARLPARRVSRPVRETAGPGSLQLSSLMQTLVGTRTCRTEQCWLRAALSALCKY